MRAPESTVADHQRASKCEVAEPEHYITKCEVAVPEHYITKLYISRNYFMLWICK